MSDYFKDIIIDSSTNTIKGIRMTPDSYDIYRYTDKNRGYTKYISTVFESNFFDTTKEFYLDKNG
jgi:hypothetical protein